MKLLFFRSYSLIIKIDRIGSVVTMTANKAVGTAIAATPPWGKL